MIKQTLGLASILASFAIVYAAAAPQEKKAPPPPPPKPAPPSAPAAKPVEATATIEPRSASTLTGTARFVFESGSVTLTLNVEHAPPGEHAVHLHETGDCSAPDASSAGAHWNPGHANHGRWGEPPFHLGDIGNLHVGEDGTGSLILTTDKWTIGTGGTGDILGHAVIVHEKPDDFKTQPTGAAGSRLGCGVVRR